MLIQFHPYSSNESVLSRLCSPHKRSTIAPYQGEIHDGFGYLLSDEDSNSINILLMSSDQRVLPSRSSSVCSKGIQCLIKSSSTYALSGRAFSSNASILLGIVI